MIRTALDDLLTRGGYIPTLSKGDCWVAESGVTGAISYLPDVVHNHNFTCKCPLGAFSWCEA
jgi:hypothetical protein